MSDNLLKSYLFVIDSSKMSLDDALNDVVDGLKEVVNWQVILPDAAVLVTELSVKDLNQILRTSLPDQKFILVLLERGKKEGWLAKSSWTFMNEPTSVTDE